MENGDERVWAVVGGVVTAAWVIACATGRPADALPRAAAAAAAALVTAAVARTSPTSPAVTPGGEPAPTVPADLVSRTSPARRHEPATPARQHEPATPGGRHEPATPGGQPAPTVPADLVSRTSPANQHEPATPGGQRVPRWSRLGPPALALIALPLALMRPSALVVTLIAAGLLDHGRGATWWQPLDRLVALVGFMAVTGAVMASLSGAGQHWPIDPSQGAAALIVAGTLAVLAGSRCRSVTVLLAPALLAAANAVPVLPHLELAIAAALAAAALALFGNEPAAIAAMSLGPLAVTATRPAGLLLAAAAVLAAAVPRREALLAAMPGAVALTAALADHRLTAVNAAVAAGLIATVGLIAWHPRPAPPDRLGPRHAAAGALLAWLAFLPRSWQWTGSQRVAEYQRGAAVAAAGAAFTAIAVLAWNLRHARLQEARRQEAQGAHQADQEGQAAR